MPHSTDLIIASGTFSLNGVWECLKDPSAQFQAVSLPDNGWRAIPVPSNWNRSVFENYNGVLWYRTEFHLGDLDDIAGALIEFKGVDYFSDAWLNGSFVGHHEGYFQYFEHSVRPLVRLGKNTLLVRVNSPVEEPGEEGWPTKKRLIKGVLNHHDCRPGGSCPKRGQEQNTGGIWNDVQLRLVEEVEFYPPTIRTKVRPGLASITIVHSVHNHTSTPISVDLQISITSDYLQGRRPNVKQFRRVVVAPGRSSVETVLPINQPRLWSSWDQGEPNLYQYQLVATTEAGGVQDLAETFGIRDIQMSEDFQFSLNGRPLFLRGTNVIPTQWLGDYSPSKIAQDIRLLKNANVNCVRVHGHIQREEFYRACDAAGILVWSDFPLQWGYEDSDEFHDQAKTQIRDWIQLLGNRPSILAWCCHNEPTTSRHTLTPLLAEIAREEDPTRPVFEASDFRQHAYPGWYAGHLRDFAKLPGAPLITEYGAQALPDEATLRAMLSEEALSLQTPEHWAEWAFHNFQIDQTFNVAKIEPGPDLSTFVAQSQAYQAQLIKFATEYYRSHKWQGVTGIFQFMFMDCWPSISWSILDHARRPKLGYEALQRSFQPLLITFCEGWLQRDKLEIGTQWSLATVLNATIVNDLPREFKNARLCVSVELDNTTEIELYHVPVDIPADSVIRPLDVTQILEGNFQYPELPEHILGQIARCVYPGNHRLIARIFDANGSLLSENEDPVEWVAPTLSAPSPFSTQHQTPPHEAAEVLSD